jgi:hypothetical protein
MYIYIYIYICIYIYILKKNVGLLVFQVQPIGATHAKKAAF